MTSQKDFFYSESQEEFVLNKELIDATTSLSSDNEQKIHNENAWLTQLICIFKVLTFSGFCLLLSGGYIFVFFTLTTRKDSANACHSSNNMVASITSACHFSNGMQTSISPITRSSQLSNNSISKSVSIDAKIGFNISKASSLDRTQSFNTTKTTFFFSIRPPTIQAQYRLLSKKMDSSPSFCRAIVDNPNCGAMARISSKIRISKQHRKKKKDRNPFRRRSFWRSLRKKIAIRRKKFGTRALVKQLVDRALKNHGYEDTTKEALSVAVIMVGLSQSNLTHVAKAINLLPFLVTIFGESAPQILENVDEGVVKYLPVIDSGINVLDAVRKTNDRWSQSPLDEKIQMETSAVDTKVQETLLYAMDNPGLIVAVTEAKKQDIQGIKNMDGSSYRFKTLEELWPSERLKDVQTAFLEGNPTPLFSRIAATQFLCIWNSSLMISRGAPQSRQRILDNTLAFQTRMRNRFEDIVTFKKPVSQSDPFFTQFHIWGNSLSYMRENFDETEKQSLDRTDQYWQEREPELIAMSFQKGCEKYQEKFGIEISSIDLQSYINQFIEKKFL